MCVHVFVHVLLVDGEVAKGENFGVEISTSTAGKESCFNIVTVTESDVVDLSGNVSASGIGSECSLVLPVSGDGGLLNTDTTLDLGDSQSGSCLGVILQSHNPVAGEVGEMSEQIHLNLVAGAGVVVEWDGVDSAELADFVALLVSAGFAPPSFNAGMLGHSKVIVATAVLA